jgi:hypothetical protein
MAEETQYTANTSWVTIATANANLDGTGTMGNVIQGAANGTLVKKIRIKATTSTSQGMVRLFVDNRAGTIKLLQEILVPANTKSSINPAFEAEVNLNFTLKSGYTIVASTQVADTFNIIAEGLDWTYYSTSVRTDTTQYLTNTGTNIISTANSNLDGTGSVTNVYVTGSSATYKGSSVRTITIKAATDLTVPGMIRLYLYDNVSTIKLFKEVFVPSKAQSGSSQSFEKTVVFENDLDIKSGWAIMASTQQGQVFYITVEGNDWKYLP